MINTKEQLLRDSSIEPTNKIIAKGLAAANYAYLKFINKLKDNNIQVYWHYYNDGKAWLGKALYKWTTIRGTEKEMTAFWLSIWNGFFRVSIYLPEKTRADALNLPLDDETKKMIKNSKQMGKLKFFPLIFDVRSDSLTDDIYSLINFRITIK